MGYAELAIWGVAYSDHYHDPIGCYIKTIENNTTQHNTTEHNTKLTHNSTSLFFSVFFQYHLRH